MAQNFTNVMLKYSIQTIPRMHEIRSTIENVSTLPYDKKLFGPDFYLAPECICCIAFEKHEKGIRLYICNKSDQEVNIARTITLYDCNYEKLYEDSGGIFIIFEKDDIVVIETLSGIYNNLPEDTLIIVLCVVIKDIFTVEPICHLMHAGDPVIKLREDMKSMLENPVKSDVSLQVGDELIPAHWSVLTSRSSYFKKMFDVEMQNSISIPDLSLSTLKKLLEFLYTADFDDSGNLQELFDLYHAAVKCEVIDLRTLCVYRILHKTTPDNVFQILQFAHIHNDKHLKIEAMHFIRLEAKVVFETDGFKKFQESEPLAAFVFKFRFRDSPCVM